MSYYSGSQWASPWTEKTVHKGKEIRIIFIMWFTDIKYLWLSLSTFCNTFTEHDLFEIISWWEWYTCTGLKSIYENSHKCHNWFVEYIKNIPKNMSNTKAIQIPSLTKTSFFQVRSYYKCFPVPSNIKKI